jgi:hypothetical protein
VGPEVKYWLPQGLRLCRGVIDSASVFVVRVRGGDDAPPHRFGHCFDRVATAPRRSRSVPSTGLAQKANCSSERREIMTRRNSLDEVRELLPQDGSGVSTGQ